MTSGFTASSEQLTQMSSKVGQVASSIRECVTAANTEGVGGLVYGVLFDPTILPVLDDVKDGLAELVGSVADAANGIATGLRNNAATYDSVEQFLHTHFVALQSQAANGGE